VSNVNKQKDEKIDGAKIAADILKALPTAKRERLLQSVAQQAPALSIKISDNLFNFNDIAKLTSKGVQTLIAAIDHKDLVLSFKTASEEVKEIFLNNMSERKAKLVNEDFLSLGKTKLSEVEDAQKKILKILDDLRTSGQIRSEDKKDIWV
jgi:flagellar motor switch protein FliG